MILRAYTKEDVQHSRPRQYGMSLLEVLGVSVLILICMNVCMSLFISNFRLGALGHTALDQLGGLEETETLFRESVRPAVGFAEAVADYRAGADCLILRYPPENDRPRYVVVGALDTEDCICRMELSQGEEGWEILDFRAFPARVESFQFITSMQESGSAQVALEFTLKKDKPKRHESTRHHLLASLRGKSL